MSDDTTNRGPQDAARVSLSEDYEVRYWTGKWNISREKLEEAVAQVGNSAEKIAIYLGKRD